MKKWAVRAAVVRQIRRGEGGQALVWTAVMLPLFLAIVGLAIDAGIVFDARRSLQNVADSAARAGAMQIDQSVYRQSSGQSVVLDPGAARAAAEEYVASQGAGTSATISVGTQTVMVQVSRNVPTGFLRLVGIGTVRITAAAPAAARFGISGESP